MTRTYHRRGRARKAALGSLVAVLAAAYAFRRWRPFRIEVHGSSMSPTLEPGDWAVAVRTDRSRKGDVVVVEHPERPGFEMVKRVVASPGEIAPDGSVLLDGRVWVEGDNPDGSTDSRRFGPVPNDLVKGRVMAVWWPPRSIGLL